LFFYIFTTDFQKKINRANITQKGRIFNLKRFSTIPLIAELLDFTDKILPF